MPEQPSIFDEYELVTANSTFFRVVALDQVWTDTAYSGMEDQSDLPTLERIFGELRDLVGRLGEFSYSVVRIAESLDPSIDAVAAELSVDEVRDIFASVVGVVGGVAPLARKTYQDLVVLIPNEQAELDRQWDVIRRGGRVEGDLSRHAMCNLADILMAGGAVASILPPHLHGPAAVAAGVAIYKTHRCWELDPARPRPAGT